MHFADPRNGPIPLRVRPVEFPRRLTSLWPFARTARGVFLLLYAALRPSTDQREALPGLHVLQAAGRRAHAVALRPQHGTAGLQRLRDGLDTPRAGTGQKGGRLPSGLRQQV